MLMKVKAKSYWIAHENSLKVLKNKIDDFYIFPLFFLEKLNDEDLKTYKIFEKKDFDKYLEDSEFNLKIDEIINRYDSEIKNLIMKSNLLSKWKNLWDNNNFFQYLMDSDYFRNKTILLNFKDMIELDKKVENNEISGEEVLEKCGFSPIDFEEYLKKEKLDYLR